MTKYLKGLLFALLLIVGGSFAVQQVSAQNFVNAPVGAASTLAASPPAQSLQDQVITMLEFIVKMLYLFLRPLLAIAGASLDNSLVYGQVFYLDRTLWQFWQMMRTFANFTLGFLLIASILMSFFSEKTGKLKLTTVLRNLFISGILINMSRWIVAVLIDFSTILTVTVGGLPLTVNTMTTATDTGTAVTRYLSMHAQFDLDNSNNAQTDVAEHTVVYSCPLDGEGGNSPKRYFLPCWLENGSFIKAGNVDGSEPQSWFGFKNGFVKSRANIGGGTFLSNESIDDNWCVYQYDLLPNCSVQTPLASCGILTAKSLETLKVMGAAEVTKRNCSTLEDFLTKAKGMTGPLYNLYSSILNMGQIALSSNHQSLVETGISMMMKVFVGIALLLPLLALAVVLIMRVVVLWVIIAFSPFLIVLYVFDFAVPGLGKKGSLKSIMGLIFLPVFASFAISMSLIFLNQIGRIELIKNDEKVDAMQILGVDKSTCDFINGKSTDKDSGNVNCTCYQFLKTNICLDQGTRTTGSNILNVMTWLVTNFFGIALMWAAIFFALKSNDITSGVSDSISGRGKSVLSNMPMVPMLGGGLSMVSPAALSKASQQIGRIPGKMAQSNYQDSQLGKFINQFDHPESSNEAPTVTDRRLADKVTTNSVTTQDVKTAVAEGKEYSNYNQLVPALISAAKATGKQVTYSGASFTEAVKDKGILQFMQENNLLQSSHWIKSNSPTTQATINAYYQELTNALATHATPAGTIALNSAETWYWIADGLNGNLTKIKQNTDGSTDIVTVPALAQTPTRKEDRDAFNAMIKNTDIDVLTNPTNPAHTIFASYLTSVSQAVTNGGTADIQIATRNYRLTAMLTPGTRILQTVSIAPLP